MHRCVSVQGSNENNALLKTTCSAIHEVGTFRGAPLQSRFAGCTEMVAHFQRGASLERLVPASIYSHLPPLQLRTPHTSPEEIAIANCSPRVQGGKRCLSRLLVFPLRLPRAFAASVREAARFLQPRRWSVLFARHPTPALSPLLWSIRFPRWGVLVHCDFAMNSPVPSWLLGIGGGGGVGGARRAGGGRERGREGRKGS